MCGLAYIKRHDGKVAQKAVKKLFETQRARGTEGFGFIELNCNKITGEVRTQTEKEALDKLIVSQADEILFHHRYPTSTPNFVESTHPIKVSNRLLKYDYYFAHNGIIHNDIELKAQHTLLGFKYTTEIIQKWQTSGNTYTDSCFNDSEALAIDFCLALETKQEMKAQGSIAFIAIKTTKKGVPIGLLYGRNDGNTLKVHGDKSFLGISSQTGKDIKTHTLFTYDYKTRITTQKEMMIGHYAVPKHIGYNTGYTDTYGKEYTPELSKYSPDEDDFVYDLYEEQDFLETELKRCLADGNHDEAVDYEVELQDLKVRIYQAEKDLDDKRIQDIAKY